MEPNRKRTRKGRQNGGAAEKKPVEEASPAPQSLLDCPCEKHLPNSLLCHEYTIQVDELFDLLFGSNEFINEYRKSQKFIDLNESDWTFNETNRRRERILQYKVPFEAALIGRKNLMTREEQRIIEQRPTVLHIVESEVFNEGVQYSDCFSLTLRYCLFRISANQTRFRVTAQVSFIKSLNSVIKKIIEHNAYSASKGGLKDLDSRLKVLTQSRPTTSEAVNEVSPDFAPDEPLVLPEINQAAPVSSIITTKPDRLLYFVIFLIVCLFFMHLHLYMKLSRIDWFLDMILYPKNVKANRSS